ncbi:ANR27-like protein [Mya arenaria]|uniref:ANR27-like protein n=1 Tax=Mya arenaria TaxID=6604 RepID=A0ABY7ETN8_MYAAR|nr:ANR27-like protein [Mya arenaria]
MSRYDEDLYDNPFFIYLEKQLKPLFDKAASNRWIVCIPRYAAVKDEKLSQSDGEDHILVPSPGSESAFSTVSKHTVTVQQGVIVLGNGFKHKKKVEILFEETFFNSSDESYRVLCVGELFNRDKIAENKDKDSVDYSRPPATYEECYKILWGITGSTRTKESLDKVLLTFCAEYQRFTGDITPSLVKRNIKQYDMYMASLKLSVEMYFMNAVHKHLFATITNCVRTTDANLNKMNRNLVDVRLEHLDVRPEYDQNLPAARKELSMTANLMYMKHFLLSRVTETDEFRQTQSQQSQDESLATRGKDPPGLSPLPRKTLHLAAFYGQAGLIDILVKLRCLTDASDYLGCTPLHMATLKGHQNVICVKAILFLDILKSRLNVNAQNDMGDTPLHLAAKVRNRKRQTPLNVAQNPDIKKALQIVLDDPPPLIYRHPESTIKPVHYSKGTVTPNPKNTIPTLSPAPTPNGQDDQSPETPHGFEIVDVRDRSPVQLVDNSSKEMMSPRTPVVASLDQAENTRQVKYHFGWMDSDTSESPSPISRQATASDKMCHPLCQCDKCLDIQKHSNMNCVSINCQSKRGFAPLHTCVIENNLEVFTLLLKKGAFVNILTNKHITPLHLACHHDRPQKNSRLDVCNTNGNTPLHHTAIRGCFESTKLLLQNGARPDVVNKHNHSPLDVAKSEEVRQLLLKELETLPPISEKSDTKNEDIFNHGGLNTVHKGTLNKPADGGRHQSSDPKLLNQSSTTRCHSLHKSRTFDGGPVITPDRENLSLSIKTFDKQRKLKRSKTFDHSSPNIDNPELKLSLSIQHFDKVNSLRHVEITDKSRAMLEQLKLPLEIQHFETGTLKHVEPLDKSSPMYIYEISRDTSCYSDYCDTPMVEKTEEFQFKGDKFVDKCSNTDSDQSTVSKENITGESEVCETPDDTLFEHSRTGDHVDELQHGRAVTNSSELKNGGDDIDAFLKERDTTDKVLYEPISSINSSMDLPDEDIENCT